MKSFLKTSLFFLISLFIGIGLFIWIGKVVGWSEIRNAFLIFTGWQGAAIFGLTFLIMIVSNWRWKEILKGKNVKISFCQLFKPYLVGFSITFLAPILLWGGEIFRVYFLKKKNSVPFEKTTASVFIDRILEWTTNLVIIFLGVLFFSLIVGSPPVKLGVIFGGVFLLFAGGISYFYLKVFRKKSMVKFFLRLSGLKNLNKSYAVLDVEKEIFDFFRLEEKSMWKGFGLSILRAGIMYSRAWILIFFLGKTINPLFALPILGFSYLAAMIPIPAALGTHEAIQIFAFNSFGLGISTATAFTMIIRGAELIVALIGLIVLFRLGIGLVVNFIKK